MGFGTLGLQSLVTGTTPWALAQDVNIDLDFVNNRGFQGAVTGTVAQFIQQGRAGSAYAEDNSGSLIYLFANNVPRITNKGLLGEEARTNVVLWNRDLTNAAWTKSGLTTALNQTGVDATSNSATALTDSGAGNSTILQSITLGNSARFQSAYVKRITGTGTINMTMDNGSTWTAITVTSTTAWSRVTIPTQTITNPIVGFQIVTASDAIAVDFVQNENGAFVTSPIATTTVAVARINDQNVSFATLPVTSTTFTCFMHCLLPDTSGTRLMLIGNASLNNRLIETQSDNTHFDIYNGTNTLSATAGSGGWQTASKAAVAVTPTSRAACMNNGTVATDANTNAAVTTNLQMAQSGAGGVFWIKRFGLWTSLALSNARLGTLTTL